MIYIIKLSLLCSITLILSPKTSKMIFVEGGTIEAQGVKQKIEPFWIDEKEVTIAEFETFVQETGYVTIPEKEKGCKIFKDGEWQNAAHSNWRHDEIGNPILLDKYKEMPVSNISVIDAKAYAKWAGKELPTLKQWLFAAKGGNKSKGYKYSGGNTVRLVAWVDSNTFLKRQKVKTKHANELGIFDMSGNLHEFVYDSEKGTWFARGGCFFSDKEFATIDDPGWAVKEKETFHTFGFRCIKNN